MKKVLYRLPPNMKIFTIVDWCQENSIPMLFMASDTAVELSRYTRRECRKYYSEMSSTYVNDYLIIRDCDYELVRLRF